MIQFRSVLTPADNSGARKLMVIGIPHYSRRRFAYPGMVVRCVVDRADPTGAVKDSQKVQAVIVRTRKEIKRPDGTYVRFDDNAGVVVDTAGNPVGTRIFGPIAREVKDAGFARIASLAPEVV